MLPLDTFPSKLWLGIAIFGLIVFLVLGSRGLKIWGKGRKINRALARMQLREPQWAKGQLIDAACEIFFRSQEAWSHQDLKALTRLLHPSLHAVCAAEISQQQQRQEKNEISALSLNSVTIVDVQNFLDDEKDNFTVYISAKARNTKSRRGKVYQEKHEAFEEFWTFEWEQGKWTLLAVSKIEGWEIFVNKSILYETVCKKRLLREQAA
jgi:predicted lipid-binding transport protein (Tim44 family)